MNSGEALPKNIILVGMMGCGKSTIGRKLQSLLGYPFVDTDQLIEEKAQMSVADIFEKRGEPYFRELESAVLHELAAPNAGGSSRPAAGSSGESKIASCCASSATSSGCKYRRK
jgi:predicted ATPase with chaperone activity